MKQIERIEDTRADDIGTRQRFRCTAFVLNESDTKICSTQHLAIIAAIADGDHRVCSQRVHEPKLGCGLIFDRDDGEFDRKFGKLCFGKPEGIGRDHVNIDPRRNAAERLRHAREQPAIQCQRTVVVQDQVRKLELGKTGDVDSNHGNRGASRHSINFAILIPLLTENAQAQFTITAGDALRRFARAVFLEDWAFHPPVRSDTDPMTLSTLWRTLSSSIRRTHWRLLRSLGGDNT